MNKKPLQLPPFKTGLDDIVQIEQIREDAIARQSTDGVKKTTKGESSGRKTYPSDVDRWSRMVTVTLPDQNTIDTLKKHAKEMDISPTKLGLLMILAGLDLLEEGKLKLVNQPTEVEQAMLKLVSE